MNKKYYVVYCTPVQWGALYHTGEHPLKPSVLDAILSKIARMINITNGMTLPKEAVTVTWVTEVPDEPAVELYKPIEKELEGVTDQNLFAGVCN